MARRTRTAAPLRSTQNLLGLPLAYAPAAVANISLIRSGCFSTAAFTGGNTRAEFSRTRQLDLGTTQGVALRQIGGVRLDQTDESVLYHVFGLACSTAVEQGTQLLTLKFSPYELARSVGIPHGGSLRSMLASSLIRLQAAQIAVIGGPAKDCLVSLLPRVQVGRLDANGNPHEYDAVWEVDVYATLRAVFVNDLHLALGTDDAAVRALLRPTALAKALYTWLRSHEDGYLHGAQFDLMALVQLFDRSNSKDRPSLYRRDLEQALQAVNRTLDEHHGRDAGVRYEAHWTEAGTRKQGHGATVQYRRVPAMKFRRDLDVVPKHVGPKLSIQDQAMLAAIGEQAAHLRRLERDLLDKAALAAA